MVQISISDAGTRQNPTIALFLQNFKKKNLPQEGKVTILIIAKGDFNAFGAYIDFLTECEKHFGRKLDQEKLRFVSLPSLEVACQSPLLQEASFVFDPNNDLPEVDNYPELEKILPFESSTTVH